MRRRMTQEQFAEVLDISVDFLSLVERGISAPSFETLDKISKKLRVPVADFFLPVQSGEPSTLQKR
jgi:transcriptional regulator with XRE-family HTH domain